MKIGILGSGMVAQALGSGFLKSGHQVKLGTRDSKKLVAWLKKSKNQGATAGTFAEAAAFGDLVILAVAWSGAKNAVDLAGKKNFTGKIVIDVTNPLADTKKDEPVRLALGFPDSAGATVQRWLADAKVVKAFNIVTAGYMANPRLKEGTPDMLIAGNDPKAKKTVMDILRAWGWDASDLGGIEQAYLLEAMAMVWILYGMRNNHWTHAFKLLKK